MKFLLFLYLLCIRLEYIDINFLIFALDIFLFFVEQILKLYKDCPQRKILLEVLKYSLKIVTQCANSNRTNTHGDRLHEELVSYFTASSFTVNITYVLVNKITYVPMNSLPVNSQTYHFEEDLYILWKIYTY